MKVARFVLKIVALSLTAAGVICAIIAYWDKLAELGDYAKSRTGGLRQDQGPAEGLRLGV